MSGPGASRLTRRGTAWRKPSLRLGIVNFPQQNPPLFDIH